MILFLFFLLAVDCLTVSRLGVQRRVIYITPCTVRAWHLKDIILTCTIPGPEMVACFRRLFGRTSELEEEKQRRTTSRHAWGGRSDVLPYLASGYSYIRVDADHSRHHHHTHNSEFRMMKESTSIHEATERMRRGVLTPTDLVERCLSKIEQVDDRVGGAWVYVDREGARREARRLTELATRGEFVGPLHGIPIGIKDMIDVAGMPTKAGSSLHQNAPAAMRDAAVVTKLRRAGAIILGKTVTTEWACMDPPSTRNPFNVRCTPGGSSSGSAVAVAAGMCMAALGTQTAGSILRPASYCGICGLKPTFSPDSMLGIAPISFHLDHVGPMARNVADLMILHNVMVEDTEPAPRASNLPPVLSRLDEFFWDHTDVATRKSFQEALDKLTEAEWKDAPRLPDSFHSVHDHHATIMAVDAAQVHAKTFHMFPEKFSPKITELIRYGLSISLPQYVISLRHQQNFCIEMSQLIRDGGGLWVMPCVPATAPGPETTGDTRFNLPWSYCGFPAVTIPCGLDDERGMPVGLQIVAPRGKENELLCAAAWCQEKIDTPLPYQDLPVIPATN